MAKQKQKPAAKRKRRPGMPRKSDVLNRITLRLDGGLFDAMDQDCEREDITQREFVEEALREELGMPSEIPPGPQPTGTVRRAGMWIDPALVRAMDERLDKDKSLTQRALLERAVRRRLEQRRAEANA